MLLVFWEAMKSIKGFNVIDGGIFEAAGSQLTLHQADNILPSMSTFSACRTVYCTLFVWHDVASLKSDLSRPPKTPFYEVDRTSASLLDVHLYHMCSAPQMQSIEAGRNVRYTGALPNLVGFLKKYLFNGSIFMTNFWDISEVNVRADVVNFGSWQTSSLQIC